MLSQGENSWEFHNTRVSVHQATAGQWARLASARRTREHNNSSCKVVWVLNIMNVQDF